MGPRLAFTMEVMFEQDQEFREGVLQVRQGGGVKIRSD